MSCSAALEAPRSNTVLELPDPTRPEEETPVTKVIDYFFAAGSPFAYLGHDRFVAIAGRHSAQVNVKPLDIGKVFAVSGGLPLKQRSPQRQAYRLRELARWSAFLDRPLNPQPKHFPVANDLPAKWTIAAGDQGAAAALALSGALMRALWAEDRDIGDPATLADIAREQKLDGRAISDRAMADDVSARYDRNTSEAIDRQVFGAPTFIYRDELFWGQDRLDFLDRALAG
jgi:2-hydroxychromene-2-carboxylate isomerase